MKIYKVINNNMVSIRNTQGRETMLKGLSIGYKKKPGDEVDQSKIEMRFVLENGQLNRQFNEMITEVDQNVIDVCMDTITMVKNSSSLKLRDSIYVTIIDHVNSLLERIKAHLVFDNSLLWDIQRIYPTEFYWAQKMVEIFQKKLSNSITNDEANFIALHIVNAEANDNMSKTYKLTNAINDICDIVSSDMQIEFSSNDYFYNRFIMHLRFMLENSGCVTNFESQTKSKTLQSLRKEYKNASQTLNKIEIFISDFLHRSITDDERLYLMIHLTQLWNKDTHKANA